MVVECSETEDESPYFTTYASETNERRIGHYCMVFSGRV
jgi:hypothetical protein